MAASKWQMYNEAKKYVMGADADLNGAALRIKLCKGTGSASISDYTRSTFASLSFAPSNLKTNPKTPTNVVLTQYGSAKCIMWDMDDTIFSASGGDATSLQYAVMGLSGGKAIAWCKMSTAVFTLTNGNTLTITQPTGGLFQLTGGTTA